MCPGCWSPAPERHARHGLHMSGQSDCCHDYDLSVTMLCGKAYPLHDIHQCRLRRQKCPFAEKKQLSTPAFAWRGCSKPSIPSQPMYTQSWDRSSVIIFSLCIKGHGFNSLVQLLFLADYCRLPRAVVVGLERSFGQVSRKLIPIIHPVAACHNWTLEFYQYIVVSRT